MAVADQLSVGKARLFIGEDMSQAEILDAGAGVAALYSSRSPGKQTANEDAAGVFRYGDSECVLAVADGLGGLRAGHQASSLAIESVKQALAKGLGEGHSLRDAVLNGFEDANRSVLDLGIGAATTLAVVEIQGANIRPYHVGDSLIVVVGQRGRIKLQSVPHSPVGYGIESGLLDESEAMYHEERHIVSNVIGTPDMRIEVGSALELAPRDRLLVASDGLWDNLHMNEIVGTVRKGPLLQAVVTLTDHCDARMHKEGVGGTTPSKPDDLTLVLFCLHSPSRKGGSKKPNS
jgi:serine/threonine protein phosphatase PrpC